MPVLIRTNEFRKKWDIEMLGQEVYEKYWFEMDRLTNYHEDCLSWYKLYKGYFDTTQYPYRHTLFINLTHSIIETIMPRMFKSLFSSKPYITVKPQNRDGSKFAPEVESALNSQYDNPLFIPTMCDWIKQGLWFGMSPLKLYWDYNISKIPDGQGGEYAMVNSDTVGFEVVNVRNFFYPDEGKSLRQKPYVIERYMKSRNYVETQAKTGYFNQKHNVQHVLDNVKSGDNALYTQEKEDRNVVNNYQTDILNKYAANYTLLEYYDAERNIIVVVEETTKKVLRIEDNYYGCIPYANITPINEPFRTEGISVIEPFADVQSDYNAKTNIALDWLSMSIAPLFLLDATAKLNEADFERKPGKILKIWGGGKNALTVVENPPLPEDFWRFRNDFAGVIQQVTGVNDYSQGNTARGMSNETATGISLLIGQANERIGQMSELVGAGVQEMVDIQMRLNALFWGELTNSGEYRNFKNVERSRIDLFANPDKFVDVYKENFWKDYKYQIGSVGRPESNPQIQVQQLMEYLGVLTKIPPEVFMTEGYKPSFVKLIQQIERLRGIDSLDILTPIQTPMGGQFAGQMGQMLQGGTGMEQAVPPPSPEGGMPVVQ